MHGDGFTFPLALFNIRSVTYNQEQNIKHLRPQKTRTDTEMLIVHLSVKICTSPVIKKKKKRTLSQVAEGKTIQSVENYLLKMMKMIRQFERSVIF